MTARATHPGFGMGAVLASVLLAAPVSTAFAAPLPPVLWDEAAAPADAPKSATPTPTKPTPAQLRTRAVTAEAAGDWEASFAAYCELYAADRTAPGVREKLNAALRRVQQVRRHRDPAFRQFITGLTSADAANLFGETVAKVSAAFADPDKSTPQRLWANGVEELDRALASAAFLRAYLDGPPAVKVEVFRDSLRLVWAKRTVGDAREARSVLKQLLAAAQDAFPVRQPAALVVEVVCGACSGLDEYTVFLTPTQAAESADTPADLTPYGLYLGFDSEGVAVEGVTPGSWAAFHTPLRKGDRVARLNGRSMPGGPMAVADALRMPVDGFHEIEVVTPAPGLMGVVRLPLAVPTVYGGRLLDPKGEGVGYVRVSEFRPGTPRELAEAVAGLKAEGMRALVLDLRGNPGGSFLAGVEVARHLLPAGLIVTTSGQLSQLTGPGGRFSSDSGMTALDTPLVVLVDADTASAAEVVAAALRDNNRAVLVGMPTFGKGTIQCPLKLTAADEPAGAGRSRSGAVRVTVARLIAPHGGPINGVGVTPHFLEADPTRQIELAVERALDLLQPVGPRSPVMPMPLSN